MFCKSEVDLLSLDRKDAAKLLNRPSDFAGEVLLTWEDERLWRPFVRGDAEADVGAVSVETRRLGVVCV